MNRIIVAAVALCLVAWIASYAQGSDYPVIPPSDTRYSSSEQAVLASAIDRLSEDLRQSEFSCMKYYPAEWSSRQFAAYAQGTLSRLGYASVLVGTAGSGSEHVWLLVSVSLGLSGNVAWIPVEATPASGSRQVYLGRIPLTLDASGSLVYEDAYRQFDEVVELPANIAPNPVIRPIPSHGVLGDSVRFLGTLSSDPDGEIILWLWSFGDDSSSTDRSPEHLYAQKGTYQVSLTVIDSRGASRTVTQPYTVGDPHGEPTGYDCPSCG